MAEDEFTIPPPEFEEKREETLQLPMNEQSAIVAKMIEAKITSTQLPDELKHRLISDMNVLVYNAATTNVTLGHIRLFLYKFEKLWMKSYIFVYGKKHRKTLVYLKDTIRTLYEQNLLKSYDFGMAKLIFEDRKRYDVTQRNIPVAEKMKGFFKKKPIEEKGDEMG